MIDNKRKEAIRTAAAAYVARYSSQNKAANSLKGVSAGTLSSILSGKWDLISDEMWSKLEAQVISGRQGWQLYDTKASLAMMLLMEDAQADANVTWITGPAGIGKSTAARRYADVHRNAFVITCSNDMTRTDFVHDLASAIGVDTQGLKVRECLQEIVRELIRLECPLLIFDEGDKLSDSVLYYYITLYNQLEDFCGMVFLSTDYIRKRVSRGVQACKKGYDELESRICRRFIPLDLVNENEVAAICRANGLEDATAIATVKREAADCRNDLRRVRKCIHRELRKISLASQ